jgi:hypothetical protein
MSDAFFRTPQPKKAAGRSVPIGVGFCALLLVFGCAGSRVTSSSVQPPAAALVASEAPVAMATTVAIETPVAPAAPATWDEQVVAACSGAAVPGAAPYGGSVHPLYVVSGRDVQRADQQRYSFDSDAERLAWLRDEWSSPLQLVLCVGSTDRVEVDSCGTYMDNFGQPREVLRYRTTSVVTLVEAATGKTQRTETVPGPDPEPCAQTVQSAELVGAAPDVYKFALLIAGG